jgi:predicted dehydrogenase
MARTGKKWRVAILGAGWVSAYHLEAWRRQNRRAEVVALADPDATARQSRAAEFGVASTYDSAEALLAKAEIDAVDICAPREVHARLVQLATARGLPILCQKPLAPTLAEAEQLVADVDGRTRLMVHENWRFRQTYRRLRAWLDAGYAGEIRHVQLELLSSGMIPDATGARPAITRQPFFRTLDRLLVSEVLIHHIDTLRFLFGELELVHARLERSHDEIRGEDVASLLLQRRDGTPVAIVANLAVHGAPPLPKDHLHIFGADGTLLLNDGQLYGAGRQELHEAYDPVETYQGSYDSVIGHFLDCLESDSQFETSPADNLETLRIVEAAYGLGISAINWKTIFPAVSIQR